MSGDSIEERLKAVKELLDVFKPERIVYIVIASAALLLLLIAVIILFNRGQIGITELGVIGGSSGVMGYMLGQLLVMWNRCITAVIASK